MTLYNLISGYKFLEHHAAPIFMLKPEDRGSILLRKLGVYL
jgi:hypothetical protein